ncbi:unnamed protein product, partial [Mesorhabditis spiculigera]
MPHPERHYAADPRYRDSRDNEDPRLYDRGDIRKRSIAETEQHDPREGTSKREKLERISTVIQINGLYFNTDLDRLKSSLRDWCHSPTVRIQTAYRQTGERGPPRIIGYADIGSVDAVRRWMSTSKGEIRWYDGSVFQCETLKPFSDSATWTCALCSSIVSSSQDACLKCSTIRLESENLHMLGLPLVGTVPTDTLLLRDLPKGITGQRIADSLSRVASLVPITHIHLAKSKKFAFVQLREISHAEMLLECFKQAPLVIDSRTICIAFCSQSYPEWKAAQENVTQPVAASDTWRTPANEPRPPGPAPAVPSALPAYSTPTNVQRPPSVISPLLHGVPRFDPSQPPPCFLPMPDLSRPPPMIFNAPNVAMAPPTISPGIVGAVPQSPMIMGQPLHQAPPFPQQVAPFTQQAPYLSAPIHPHLAAVPPHTLSQQTSAPPGFTTTQPQPHPTINYAVPPPQTSQPPPEGPPAGGVIGQVTTPHGTFPKYVTPDPTKFVDEPKSGYKIDPATLFYYDVVSQNYYVSALKKWCYWDAQHSTYLPTETKSAVQNSVSEAPTQAAAAPGEIPAEIRNPAPDRAAEAPGAKYVGDRNTEASYLQQMRERPTEPPAAQSAEPQKSAEEITKEMQRWARKQEKERAKISITLTKKPDPAGNNKVATNGRNSDVGAKILEKMQNPLKHPDLDSSDEEEALPAPVASQLSAAKTASVDEPPPSNTLTAQMARELMERGLVDRESKTCQLCHRAFTTVEVLDKHVERSELHRANLEEKRREWSRDYVRSMMDASDGQ